MTPEQRLLVEHRIRQVIILAMGMTPDRVKAVHLGDENALMEGRTDLSLDFDPQLTPEEDEKLKNVMRNLSTLLGGKQPIFMPSVLDPVSLVYKVSMRHKFTDCGHKGFGVYCHRCDAANKLEVEIDSMKGDVAKAAKVEVARLRGPQAPRKKNRPTPNVVDPTPAAA